jgi:pimeloyl-ACP methyl ester carboxylesterase
MSDQVQPDLSSALTLNSGDLSLVLHLSGSGIPLIALHGLGSDSRDMRSDLGQLPGFRLALLDQRGHGASSHVTSEAEFGLEDLVEDLSAVLRELAWTDPVLCGGSMGAAVVLRYALTRATDYRALVLIAPAIGTTRTSSSEWIMKFADRIDVIGLSRAIDERREFLIKEGIPPEEAYGFGVSWARQDGSSLAFAMRAICEWRLLRTFEELGRIRCPVVIVGITDDPLHPIEVAQQMAAHFVRSSLVVVDSHEIADQPGVIGNLISREFALL